MLLAVPVLTAIDKLFRRYIGTAFVIMLVVVAFSNAHRCDAAAPPNTTNTVLILHDSSGAFGWYGQLNAILLANLLGHFPLPWTNAPVESYRPGDIERYRTIFYLGTTYDNALPRAFLEEVMATRKTVCWMKYNLWHLGGTTPYAATFQSRFGFRFEFMDSGGFTNIQYKGETLVKHPADVELGRATILNTNIAQAPAVAWRDSPSNSIPYILRGSNFWYVADLPFAYMSEEDRYLAFADLLHDIVGIDHAPSRRAIIRLEDVDPTYDLPQLRTMADYLHSQAAPFGVATIPVYVDPHGYYTEGESVRVELSDAPEFVDTLKYMIGRGGQLLMHGYTHQYHSELNPFTGVSGDDYEFFRVVYENETNLVHYAPVPEDSASWALGRVRAGFQEFDQVRLKPVGWVPPHYAASATDYRVFATNFSHTIQRVLYFGASGHIAGQFFPYVIQRDIYGQKVMPENLGNIELEPWYSYPARFPQDLIRAARKNRVVRDAWASAFFHPYLDVSYLREVVEGIKALGYTYVPINDAAAPVIFKDPQDVTAVIGSNVTFRVEAAGANPLRYQWRKNGANVSGATNSTLTLSNLQVPHAGTYSVIVTNQFGTMVSSNAVLTIAAPALRIQQTNGIRLTFHASPGFTYRVQYRSSLSSGSWSTLRTISGASGPVTVTEPILQPRRLYRLRAE
jgi:uncharacterized protein YdaL